jgi:hypothetical protein
MSFQSGSNYYISGAAHGLSFLFSEKKMKMMRKIKMKLYFITITSKKRRKRMN